MADRKFAHLHLHTHYSLLDGFNRIPELVKQTKALGMSACAITDHGNLYGAIEFYTKCRDAGVNPVIGYEAYVAGTDRREKKKDEHGEQYYHLTLLAKNTVGFKNLVKLSSIAFLEGFYYQPRIDREILAAHADGLICLSGCLAGMVNQLLLRNHTKKAEDLVGWYRKVFGEDFYLEIQNNGLRLAGRLQRGTDPHRHEEGRSARGHGRRPLPVQRRRDRPRRAVLHQHPADARPAEEGVPRRPPAEPVLRPLGRRHVPAVPRPGRRGRPQPGDRRQGRHPARLQEAALPGLRAPEGKSADDYLRDICTEGVASGTARTRRNKSGIGSTTNSGSSRRWATRPTS